jgi:glycerol-3-phosphate acyltransferase PlsY
LDTHLCLKEGNIEHSSVSSVTIIFTIITLTMPLAVQLLCMALGYALGAFPTAHLLARAIGRTSLETSDLDTTPQNATIQHLWERQKLLRTQLLVAFIDAAKGFLAVKIGMILGASIGGTETFAAPALTGFFAVLGHNYNMIFRHAQQYGRGLSVVAGVMAAINLVPIVIFAACWLTGYLVIRRNLYVGVMTGAIATPVLMYTAPEQLARSFMQVRCDTIAPFTFFVFILALQVFVRHLEPIRTMFDIDEHTPD